MTMGALSPQAPETTPAPVPDTDRQIWWENRPDVLRPQPMIVLEVTDETVVVERHGVPGQVAAWRESRKGKYPSFAEARDARIAEREMAVTHARNVLAQAERELATVMTLMLPQQG